MNWLQVAATPETQYWAPFREYDLVKTANGKAFLAAADEYPRWIRPVERPWRADGATAGGAGAVPAASDRMIAAPASLLGLLGSMASDIFKFFVDRSNREFELKTIAQEAQLNVDAEAYKARAVEAVAQSEQMKALCGLRRKRGFS